MKNKFSEDMDSFGFTIDEAAEALELSSGTVAAYRRGTRNPPTYYMDNFENAKYPKRKIIISRVRAKIAELEATLPKYEALEDSASVTLYIAKFSELETMKNLLAK